MNARADIVSRQFDAEHFDDLLADLLTEIKTRNYRITRINHIDQVLERRAAGIEVTADFVRYKIVELCNLNRCSELISAHLDAGVFMPVRFVIYQATPGARARIAFLKPTAFAALFASPPLMQAARRLERDMTEMLDELAY